MSRQQAYVDELLRSQHDRLVEELRFRQRNIVFPDTVRNEGVFYRNLARNSRYPRKLGRMGGFVWGFFLLFVGIYFTLPDLFAAFAGGFPIGDLAWLGVGLILTVVGTKIAVTALIGDVEPSRTRSKAHPRVKI